MADNAEQRAPVLVSACLLGVACDHKGGARADETVSELGRDHRLVPICPEVAGGLPTPRVRAERQHDGRVHTADGRDVTDQYRRGAAQAVALAAATGARKAVLKARSPSCGCHQIYDGSFTDTLVDGEGVTAQALREAGVEVCSEEDLHPPFGAPGNPV